MKDKYFLDTNIIAYLFDKSNAEKSEIATKIVKNGFAKNDCVISYQVIQEFINVALRKFKVPLSSKEIKEFTMEILEPICEVYPNSNLFLKALDVHSRYKYSFYDSLIIASGLSANCNILYTEDMQHGQTINNLKIINPFLN